MFNNILAVSVGAVFGALSRWLLASVFAAFSAPLAVGTLAANWIGALAIGILAESLNHPQLRLMLITGFLGSLTTFSGFSLEVVGMMQAQRWGAAGAALCLHVVGSFLLTALGIWLAQGWK